MMFTGLTLLGVIIWGLCVWRAIATAPVGEGEYSHLDRLDGLGDHEFIHERVNAVGGSAETATFTIRHHGGAA
ncbi:hypothetical protein O1W71_16385 [Microbacterium sp. H37-C3]|uniref:hypothetical protein n=1 Tax=Microbacterium sp. H37-C3 TaxID=3004354 RepID=UPI0022AF94C4|nr:hypothetical protein [Microbacterium sp. H37-C3]MCZ4069249.1 hypothetical protein [Microbacterium sp. H37-C3]